MTDLMQDPHPPADAGQQLCVDCGLCCQGVFHSTAVLYTAADVAAATRLDMIITSEQPEETTRWFELPCPAFKGKCTSYGDRPSVCEKHSCHVLDRVQSGELAPTAGAALVVQAKALSRQILPPLKALAGNASINKADRLMARVIRRGIKKGDLRANPELYLRYGAFQRIWNTEFYPDIQTDAEASAESEEHQVGTQ